MFRNMTVHLLAVQGLRGCGAKIAYGIAQYGLGQNLIWACENYDNAQLAMYLSDVRCELRQLLRTDPSGFIGQQCHILANNVPESFPTIKVLRNYAEPLTSWSPGRYQAATIPKGCPHEADVSRLALFCSQRFGWVPSVVHKKFETCISPGRSLRSFCLVSSADAVI
jgi:Holliday junction resolvase YEN1